MRWSVRNFTEGPSRGFGYSQWGVMIPLDLKLFQRLKDKKQKTAKFKTEVVFNDRIFFFHHGWFWSNRIIPGTDFPSVGQRFNQFVVFYRKVMDISMVDTTKNIHKSSQHLGEKKHTKEIAFSPAATSVLAHQVWCFHPNWRHWVWVFSTMKALKIFHGLNCYRIWPLDVPSWRQVWFLAWQTGTVGTCGNTAFFFFFFFSVFIIIMIIIMIIIIIIIIILGVVAKMSLYTITNVLLPLVIFIHPTFAPPKTST